MAATLSNYKVDCKFCHEQCTLESLIDHHKVCEKVIVACPYNCGPMLAREDLEQHISDGCGKMTSCCYKKAGCMFKGRNSHILAHLESGSREHMILFTHNKKQNRVLVKRRDPIIKTHKGLFWEISGITEKIAKPNCNQQSLVFVNENGYKLQAVLYPHGIGNAEGTHISIELKFLKGDFDDRLTWPFQGKMVMTLRYPWDDGKNDYTLCVIRITIQKPNFVSSGLSCSKFISHQRIFADNFIADDYINIEINVYNQ